MHYKNGREAKIGDPIVGKGYNKGIISGTLIDITPGESCNCKIGILKLNKILSGLYLYPIAAISGDNMVTLEIEYSQCDWLLHAEDCS